MNIALLHYRLIRRGGLETRLLNYLEEFSKRGHAVTVICAKWDKSITLPPGVEVQQVNLGWMLKPFRHWYFTQKAEKRVAQMDFDFVFSLGRTARQDAVLMPGGHLGYLEALGQRKSSLSDWMQIFLDRKAFASSRLIFAASTMMKEELMEKYGVEENKIRLLFPPLNSRKFNLEQRPERPQLRAELGLKEGQKAFAFVSSSHFRKGLDILQKVFAQLDEETFILLIIGMPKVKSRRKNIRYIGFSNNLRGIYTAADFMILPARYEPFGQVVSESLACGTPVMVSHQVGAKDILGPEEGLLLPSLEVDDWIKLIRENHQKSFNIPADFAQIKALSLEQHVTKILDDWQKLAKKES